jgi:hypothetical protein
MTEEQATDAIVRSLSLIVGQAEADLRSELNQSGDDWPYDSRLLAEALVTLEEELDFIVPMDKRTARALRSVRGLADLLVELATARDAA